MHSNHICIIAKYLYPYDTRLSQQAKAFLRKGFFVDVFCLGIKGQPDCETIDRLTIHRIMEKQPKEHFIKYLISTVSFGIIAFCNLLKSAFHVHFGIIVVHTLPEFLVFIGFLHKLIGKPVILDGRDISFDLLSSRWKPTAIKPVKIMAKVIEFLCIKFCDEIITASNGFKRSLVERGHQQSKIVVIENTADDSIFKFDSGRTFSEIHANARFIYHGTVSRRFGVIAAIEMMRYVLPKIPGSTLHIYGYYDKKYRKYLEKVIHEHNLDQNIILGEYLPLEEIYEIIKTMDIGVVPYLNDSFMNLALSTKTFEYIAAGIPVVASRLASSLELFDENCLYYANPGDPESLAKTVEHMCRNPFDRKSRRDAAFTAFQNYSSSCIANKYYYLFNKYVRN